MISRHSLQFNRVLIRSLTFSVGEEYVNTRIDKFIMDKYPRVDAEQNEIRNRFHIR